MGRDPCNKPDPAGLVGVGCGLVGLRFLAANGRWASSGVAFGVCGLRHDALQTSSVIEFPGGVDVDLQSLIKYQWHVGIGSKATSAGS
jgi:hypothetical protein